jgi:3-oxoacyl-[acyl-carrier protein] reductase
MTSVRTLEGRTALVTGVSRRRGIGFAVARRLLREGASVAIQHWAANDAEQAWGGDDITAVVNELRAELAEGSQLVDVSANFAVDGAPEQLVSDVTQRLGHLDILVCNQAMSGHDGTLADISVDDLELHWRVNARATLLMTKAYAAQHDGRPGGRVVWMTSGQQQGPMSDEIAYATSKAALAGVTASVAADLVQRGIVLNTVNPGPVNTGYLDEGVFHTAERLAEIRERFPLGRFGEPDDPARLIAWLVSDDAQWMVGQVLNTEGGFQH